MAIALTLRGFNDLGRSVTPIFFRWVVFSADFSTFCEKMKKNFEYFAKRFIEFRSFDLFV